MKATEDEFNSGEVQTALTNFTAILGLADLAQVAPRIYGLGEQLLTLSNAARYLGSARLPEEQQRSVEKAILTSLHARQLLRDAAFVSHVITGDSKMCGALDERIRQVTAEKGRPPARPVSEVCEGFQKVVHQYYPLPDGPDMAGDKIIEKYGKEVNGLKINLKVARAVSQ